jgi:hypothetical protein
MRLARTAAGGLGRRILAALRPDEVAAGVWEVDLDALVARGIRGVMVDLDNTLVEWNREQIPPAIAAWLEGARARGLRICLLSNARQRRRLDRIAAAAGASSVVRAGKPWPRAYRLGLAHLGTTREQTAMIGDQVFTDILGAKWAGLYTILVKPISRRDFPATKLARLLECPLRRRWEEGESSKGGSR